MEEKKENILDLTEIIPMLLKKWKVYAACMAGVIIFSLIFVFTIPRYYSCQVMLAPEVSSGGMNSILNSFGFGEAQTTNDAISPNLYPDLMKSKDFIVSMFDVEITTLDGSIKSTYYDYLLKHNKTSWYMSLIGKLKSMMKPKKVEANTTGAKGKTYSSSFLLNEKQYNIAGAIGAKIQYVYDRKTGVISVIVNDFDPLVCALIADTVSNKLQNFIMDYRTKKDRNDLAYAQRIYNQARADYEVSNGQYVAAVDANWDIINETAKAHLEALNNDKTMKYQTFSAATQKLEAAKAKLQEATPVITVLQGASVPLKPAGPKRVFTTLALMFLAGFACTIYLIVVYNSKKRKEQAS